MIWGYIDDGAEDNVSLRRNREAFGRYALRQRVLSSSVEPNMQVTIAGIPLSLPVLTAPTGMTGLAHWTGELSVARAAERAGTRAVISNAASYSLAEIGTGTRENHWFQLYPWGNDRHHAQVMLDRARAAGFHALFVTVDVPVIGARESDMRHGMGVPPTLTPGRILDGLLHYRWSYRLLRHGRSSIRNLVDSGGARAAVESAAALHRLIYPGMGWGDIKWLRDRWQGPIFVKGILDPEDAVQAVDHGADGVVVSNHGGRQLDGALGALDALPEVVSAVGNRAQVLLDGGIRRGTDVIKALALGASAVLIGRPAMYGLAVHGEQGVSAILDILRTEIGRNLTLMGCPDVRDLTRDHLVLPPSNS
jgi:L-lactate dehydrogenase (cytochrome)/(S)-mandelate dehydrogenase